MAYQSVLYPQGPLLIVDKGMRKKPGTQPYETVLPALSDKDIKVSVLGPAAEVGEPKLPQPTTTGKAPKSRGFRFVDPSKANSKPRTRRKRTAEVKQEQAVAQHGLSKKASRVTKSSPARSTDTSSSDSDLVPLLHTIPGSSSPFYRRHDNASPLIAEVLPFYGDMTHFFYPWQAYLPLKFDPVTTIYLPASLRDICMLYAIVTSAASRLQGKRGWQIDDGTVFFQGASQEMRRRIGSGDITDAVLMAATCFVLRDHCRGNIDQSQTHVNGVLQMLQVRGGIGTVHPGYRQKIYRALLNPAIDYLSRPRWPRLERDTPSLHATLSPDCDRDSSHAFSLMRSRLDSTLYEVMTRVKSLSDAINYAIEHSTPVHPFSLDQDIMLIQHDLLSRDGDPSANLSGAFRLAALVFTRLLTREAPLPLVNSETLPNAMTGLSWKIPVVPEDAILRFWCFFMGALAAQQPNNKKLLLEDVKKSCLSLRISAWEAARSHLSQIAWITPAFDDEGFELWQQVGIEPQ